MCLYSSLRVPNTKVNQLLCLDIFQRSLNQVRFFLGFPRDVFFCYEKSKTLFFLWSLVYFKDFGKGLFDGGMFLF